MTTILDGPAAGQKLMLKRSPIFLRVVQDITGKWDALDQPEDTAHLGETVHAYRLKEKPTGVCHLSTRGPRGGRQGGWYCIASYEHINPQPDNVTLRSNAAWTAWCESQTLPAHLQ